MRKSFTLIELIVVIGIIALLSGLGVSTYNGFQQAARDSRRKADLETITNALNAYYAANGRYPDPNPSGAFSLPACPNGANRNCYTHSTLGTNWIPLLVPAYIEALPQDPINVGQPSWVNTATNYSYSYGNVSPDGQQYDLTTRLENENDPDRCAVKAYRWWYTTPPNYWCTNGAVYSPQLYEFSPNSQ